MDNHAHYLRYRETYIRKSRRNYKLKREEILQTKKEEYANLSLEERASLREQHNDYRRRNPEKCLNAKRKWLASLKGRASRIASRAKEREKSRRDPRINKNRHLKRTYGITLEQFEELLQTQGGKCKLCPSKDKLVVDHSHATGKLRGILCYACNTGIGHIERFSALALDKKVVEYLKEE